MELSDVVTASDDVVAREVAGEQVLMNLSSGTYFGLNETGTVFWEVLDESSVSLAAICDAIEEEYDVARDELERDVIDLAEELIEHGLLMLEEADEDA